MKTIMYGIGVHRRNYIYVFWCFLIVRFFQINEYYGKKLKAHTEALVKKLDEAVHREVDHGDYSVYTGVTGYICLKCDQ